jgi:hypothetical protein
MGKGIGIVALTAGAVLAFIAAGDAMAAEAGKKLEAPVVRGAGARHGHPARFIDRPLSDRAPCPDYIDRPCYYAPAPFFPLPPIWGYGWEWW